MDNFVYTKESLERVKDILLPDGQVFLTFATNRDWIHNRILNILDTVFERPSQFILEKKFKYSNGIIYINKKETNPTALEKEKLEKQNSQVKVSTDDWPFLYLEKPDIPTYYIGFIIMAISLSLFSLQLLPKGKRQIEMKYFFMGAGFFLIETSNIIKLSLLYGSTWIVNITVFSGILILILLGNLVSTFLDKKWLKSLFVGLLFSCLISYFLEPKYLLSFHSPILQGLLAVVLFLAPIFFASIIFALLIRQEKDFYAAYGSNLLGAMVGGASEYLSLLMGFKFLILIAMAFYAFVWLFSSFNSLNGIFVSGLSSKARG